VERKPAPHSTNTRTSADYGGTACTQNASEYHAGEAPVQKFRAPNS